MRFSFHFRGLDTRWVSRETLLKVAKGDQHRAGSGDSDLFLCSVERDLKGSTARERERVSRTISKR